MDAFRVVIQAMQGEERQLLVQRNADTQRSAGRMRNGLILGVVLGLLVAGIAGWRVQRDSSKRELAEAALFAEKERAQVTLYSIGDAVVSADVSGNITFLNFCAEKMKGW